MKLLLKKTIACLVLLTACAAVCLAQPASGDNQPARQTNEVLGENERLPFMQADDSAEQEEPSSGSLLVRTLGAMILIVGLIFFGAWGLKKLGFGNLKTGGGADTPELTILSTVSLGGGRTISTVRFGERILLVGSTAQTFTLLADDAEIEAAPKTAPRSVAEMLASENDSFADELSQAEFKLNSLHAQGEKI